MGLGEPLSKTFLEFRTSNRSIWCIVEREILRNRLFKENIETDPMLKALSKIGGQ